MINSLISNYLFKNNLISNCFFLNCLFVVKKWTLFGFGLLVLMISFSRVAGNVLALGEEVDFEALNCLPALNLIRSTKLHLSTEPAFLPNACCAFVLSISLIILSIFKVNFLAPISFKWSAS